jgi:hypothetical protein
VAAHRIDDRRDAGACRGAGGRQERRFRLIVLAISLLSVTAACGQSDTASPSPDANQKESCAYTISVPRQSDPEFGSNTAGMFPTNDRTYVATVHRVSGNCRWTASTDTTAEIIGSASGTGDGVFVFHPVLPRVRRGFG